MEMVSAKKTKASKRRRIKTSEKLSLEMILRKSFIESMKEYVNNCSLAGVRQMCNTNLGWIYRTIWALVFCTAIATICYFLQYIWSDTLDKPLIVTSESSTYPIGSIDFPAVAICNNNRISKKALQKFALEEYPELAKKESLEDVENVILNWGRLINFSYNDSLTNDPIYVRMVQKYRNENSRIEQIMRMLAPSCEDMLVRCAWEGNIVDCQSIFSMNQIASRGHCCTFNYRVKKETSKIERQNEPGDLHGLNVLLDPMLDDYAYPLISILGFDIMILDPAHFADPHAGRVIEHILEPNMAVYLELKSTKQIAANEVRKYWTETRKCLFHDEDLSSFSFDWYSHSTCIVFCRIKTIYSLCKCTPYFYAMKGYQKGKVCTLETLKCLNKYREKLFYLYPVNSENTEGLEQEMQNSLYCPECLPDCELTYYMTKSCTIPLKTPYEGKDYRNLLWRHLNVTNKSFLSIYHPLPDANLDRLDVVYYWYEILSNIGGFSGIVIGFSVISAVEIIYFLTIRFLAHFWINYRKYH